MKIRFVRIQHIDRPTVTNRRLSAARRALQRKNDKVALFPEMQDKTTPEERVQKAVDGVAQGIAERRARTALEWRAARAMLRAMDEQDRNRFIGWWNTCGYPAHSDWLLRQIKIWQEGRIDVDARVADLRKIRRMGYEKWGHDPNWQWLPYGDPATDEPDPRLVADVIQNPGQ